MSESSTVISGVPRVLPIRRNVPSPQNHTNQYTSMPYYRQRVPNSSPSSEIGAVNPATIVDLSDFSGSCVIVLHNPRQECAQQTNPLPRKTACQPVARGGVQYNKRSYK